MVRLIFVGVLSKLIFTQTNLDMCDSYTYQNTVN